MACERGFDAYFSCFEVANLTDHNDVGILAEEGTQRRREGQADVFIDMHLVDAE